MQKQLEFSVLASPGSLHFLSNQTEEEEEKKAQTEDWEKENTGVVAGELVPANFKKKKKVDIIEKAK